ncbi:hypothetical protein GW17_00045911 [Ensete ventricosum]|nr:hypothetical protein GW17_00045911 [Ensete ventricosum]
MTTSYEGTLRVCGNQTQRMADPWNGGREGHHELNANREAEQLGWNLVKYSSRMKGVDVEDGTWSEGTELSLDRGQGHELLYRQEWDHVVPWVLHSDGVDSSCMVPKTKGASRHMHLISEKHLTTGLR